MSSIFTKRKIFPIGFGTAAISGVGGGYSFGEISSKEAENLLLFAVNSGINLFDTAPIYGFSEAERRLAGLFSYVKREKLFIVSKSGISWHENKRVNVSNDPGLTKKMLEESLSCLKTDYIDLYMVHWPDPKIDISYPLEVLKKAQEEGKILSIGLCNTSLDDLQKAVKIVKIDAIQNECNFFSRPNQKLLDFLKTYEIDFMGHSTFLQGILTGRVDEGTQFDSCDIRSKKHWRNTSNYLAKIPKVKGLSEKIKKRGYNMLEFSLALSLYYSKVCLCGMRSKEQVESILNALKNLPNEETLSHSDYSHFQ